MVHGPCSSPGAPGPRHGAVMTTRLPPPAPKPGPLQASLCVTAKAQNAMRHHCVRGGSYLQQHVGAAGRVLHRHRLLEALLKGLWVGADLEGKVGCGACGPAGREGERRGQLQTARARALHASRALALEGERGFRRQGHLHQGSAQRLHPSSPPPPHPWPALLCSACSPPWPPPDSPSPASPAPPQTASWPRPGPLGWPCPAPPPWPRRSTRSRGRAAW